MTEPQIQSLEGKTHGPIITYSTFADGQPSMMPIPVAQLETQDVDDDHALASIRFISPTQSAEFYSHLAEQLRALADACENLAGELGEEPADRV